MLAQQQTVVRTRPGASGVLVQTLGQWSTPFEITTKTAAVNHAAALEAYASYRSLVGADSVELIWCDFPMSLYGHVFFVLAVDRVEIKRIVHGVGGGGQFYAHAICRWRLQPVEDLPPA